jgi:hypothetical protein
MLFLPLFSFDMLFLSVFFTFFPSAFMSFLLSFLCPSYALSSNLFLHYALSFFESFFSFNNSLITPRKESSQNIRQNPMIIHPELLISEVGATLAALSVLS